LPTRGFSVLPSKGMDRNFIIKAPNGDVVLLDPSEMYQVFDALESRTEAQGCTVSDARLNGDDSLKAEEAILRIQESALAKLKALGLPG